VALGLGTAAAFGVGEPQIAEDNWPRALRAYLVATALGHLAWETLHLLLYMIWAAGSWAGNAFAVVHCAGGDMLIATMTLVLALAVLGDRAWPARGFGRVLAATIAMGVGYTVFSEWLNVVVRTSWAYSDLMPVVRFAGLEVGLSPLAQWVAVPLLAFACVRRSANNKAQRRETKP